MAHFAEIDSNNKVIRVLVIDNAFESYGAKYLSEELNLGGTWIQTSYNNKIRNKFAGIGDIYDPELDVFIPAQPYPSWIRDGLNWKAPKARPKGNFDWDESKLDWVSIGETL